MGKTGSVLLSTNDVFPELNLELVSGESLKIPGGTGDGYSVLLVYRGHW